MIRHKIVVCSTKLYEDIFFVRKEGPLLDTIQERCDKILMNAINMTQPNYCAMAYMFVLGIWSSLFVESQKYPTQKFSSYFLIIFGLYYKG